MMTNVQRLADSVGGRYGELLRRAVRPAPDGANLSFKSRTIDGRVYHYLYVSLGQRRVEHYLGPETPELLGTMEAGEPCGLRAPTTV